MIVRFDLSMYVGEGSESGGWTWTLYRMIHDRGHASDLVLEEMSTLG